MLDIRHRVEDNTTGVNAVVPKAMVLSNHPRQPCIQGRRSASGNAGILRHSGKIALYFLGRMSSKLQAAAIFAIRE